MTDGGQLICQFIEGVGGAPACSAAKSHTPKPLRHVWHHVLPRVCGGQTAVENLAAVCDNCFPFDTPVYAENIEAASRRWYEGDLVEVTMADGRRVTGTPNHPIMTRCGWTLLGLIKQGDNAVTYLCREERAVSVRDVERMPAKIGEIFDALCVTGSVRIPGSMVDFHGERPDGDVDVVSANGQLWNPIDAAARQFGDDLVLPPSYSEAAFLSGNGEALTLGVASWPATNGGVSGGGQIGSTARAEGFHAQPHSVTAATQRHSPGPQQCVDCICGDGSVLGELECGLSGAVSLNPVISVSRTPFAGHVYNLQTSAGLYTVDDIVVHNCHYGVHVLLYELAKNNGRLTTHAHMAGTGRYDIALRGYQAAVAAGTAAMIPNEGSD